jgi:hypothetical protein
VKDPNLGTGVGPDRYLKSLEQRLVLENSTTDILRNPFNRRDFRESVILEKDPLINFEIRRRDHFKDKIAKVKAAELADAVPKGSSYQHFLNYHPGQKPDVDDKEYVWGSVHACYIFAYQLPEPSERSSKHATPHLETSSSSSLCSSSAPESSSGVSTPPLDVVNTTPSDISPLGRSPESAYVNELRSSRIRRGITEPYSKRYKRYQRGIRNLKFWHALTLFTGSSRLKTELGGQLINRPENGLSLSYDAMEEFNRLEFWYEPHVRLQR